MHTKNMLNTPNIKSPHWKLWALAVSLTVGTGMSTAGESPSFVEESLEAYNGRMQWPADGSLRVDGLPVSVDSAAFPAPRGVDQKISLSQDGTTVVLNLPAEAIDEYNTVIKLTLQSPFLLRSTK